MVDFKKKKAMKEFNVLKPYMVLNGKRSPKERKQGCLWLVSELIVIATVYSVKFVISKEEDLISGPGTRLDHSRAFVEQSFIKVKKDRESF